MTMGAPSFRLTCGVLAIALIAASSACGDDDDDDTSSTSGGGGSTSECTPPDDDTEPASCDEAIAIALTPRPAAECTSFCAEVAACAYQETGGDPDLQQAYVDAACGALSCTDDSAMLLGPVIDACTGATCGDMQACLDEANASYGEIAENCTAELSQELLERLASVLCILDELVQTVVCISTLFLAC